jgi:hydroxymethylglutaryl-CoA lyase
LRSSGLSSGALAAEIDEVNYVVITTETFSNRNQGVSVDQALSAWHDIAAAARAAGVWVSLTVSAAFGCPFEGEVPPERVVEVIERALATPPDEIAIADTIGVGVPRQVRDLAGRAGAFPAPAS